MVSDETKHTAEPWKTYNDGSEIGVPVDGEVLTFHSIASCIAYENADRIVSCVNACTGMADPAKEVERLRASAAEQHAWEEMAERLGLPMKPSGAEREIVRLREALALMVHIDYCRNMQHRVDADSPDYDYWRDETIRTYRDVERYDVVKQLVSKYTAAAALEAAKEKT